MPLRRQCHQPRHAALPSLLCSAAKPGQPLRLRPVRVQLRRVLLLQPAARSVLEAPGGVGSRLHCWASSLCLLKGTSLLAPRPISTTHPPQPLDPTHTPPRSQPSALRIWSSSQGTTCAPTGTCLRAPTTPTLVSMLERVVWVAQGRQDIRVRWGQMERGGAACLRQSV